MPHKDPIAAAASKRAYYLAHKAEFIQRSRERRARLREELAAKKAILPLAPTPVQCADCGVDITMQYVPKHGPHCAACLTEYRRAYRAANAAKIADSKAKWKANNREVVQRNDRQYAKANPDKKTAARKKWTAANPGKDVASKVLNRQQRKKRVPTWLSCEDKWMVEQAYELAALRTKIFGFQWHVDHIIPLNGKRVSGLHVPTNLQVIPGVENLRKGNSMVVS